MKKIHSDLEALLAACGLSAKASAVYVALAKHAPATVAQTARSAKLYRTDVYASLPALKKLELISTVRSGGRTLYYLTPSSRLKTLAEQKLGVSARALLILEKIGTKAGPVRVLHGKEGLRTVLNDLTASLQRNDVFYRISSRKADTDVEQYTPTSYRAERDRKKLEQFVITNSALKARPFKKRIECLSKAVPKEEDPFEDNAAQLIYGDKIAFVDYNTETAVIVENPTIARFQTHVFRLLFKRL